MATARATAIATAIAVAVFSAAPGATHATPHLQGVIVEGVVIDAATGQPVAGATVGLVSPDSNIPSVTTDANGQFRMPAVPAGGYRVVVTKAGYVEGAYGRTRPYGTERLLAVVADSRLPELRISLWRPSGISGVVRDERDAPVAEASVHLLRRSPWTGGWEADDRTAATTSSQHGEYRFTDLEPGEYMVAVKHNTSVFATTPLRIGVGDISMANVRTTTVAGVTVAGRLTGPEGSVGGVRVDLYRADDDRRLPELVIATFESDATGTFRFEAVPPGNYTIEAVREADPRLWGRETVEVAGKALTSVSVAMEPTITLSGRVVFEGSAQPSAGDRGRVSVALQAVSTDLVWAHDRFPRLASGPVDAEGRFTITGVPPGQYVVTRADGFGRWSFLTGSIGGADADRPVTISPGSSPEVAATFTDRPAQLSGEVRAADGKPGEGDWAVLFAADRTFWHPYSARTRTAQLGADGAYMFSELPPGDYYVAVTPDLDYRAMGPAFFDALVPSAVQVKIAAGDRKTQALTRR